MALGNPTGQLSRDEAVRILFGDQRINILYSLYPVNGVLFVLSMALQVFVLLSITYFAVFLNSIYVLDNCCNVGRGQRSYNDPCFYPFRPGCTLLGFDDLGLNGPEK